ncbi:MAG: archaemetzincin [Candidatus Neomarinimicrobiota bacterium]
MVTSGTIYLVPFSIEIDHLLLQLQDIIQQQFKYHTRIKEQHFDLSRYFNPDRVQYSANDILAHLLELSVENNDKIIGLTGVDIYIPVLTFIFGQAYLGGRAGVISDYRLKNEFYGMPNDQELFEQRLTKCIIHELGHMFGILHCNRLDCVMRSATYVEEIDQKSIYLCQRCAQQL